MLNSRCPHVLTRLTLPLVLAAGLLATLLIGSAGLRAAPVRPEGAASTMEIQGPPPDSTVLGEKAGSLFGFSVAGAGDVNGDGYADVVVGAPSYNTGLGGNRGKFYLFYGGPDGLDPTPAFTKLGPADAQLGYAIASAGDVNHDGYADVVVGSPYLFNGSDPVGQVSLYTGGPGGLTFNFAHSDFAAVGSCLGWAVAGAGDLDDDGYDDILAGDICHTTSTGRVLVYHGSSEGPTTPPATILSGDQTFAFFGGAVAGAGDVDGDGYADVVVGEYGYDSGGGHNEGRAHVYHGGPGGLSATAGSTFVGKRDNYLGFTVTGGALNGDAYADVLLGGNFNFDGRLSGCARGYAGSGAGMLATPAFSLTRNSGEFGVSAALPGDLTGDGYPDAAVGAYAEDAYTGAVLLYAGGASGLGHTPALTLTGEHANSQFGYAVADAGDVNGDGYPDLIVGAPQFSADGVAATGKVYLYFGGELTGLSVRKQVFPVYVPAEAALTYTLALRNNEAVDAPGVVLTDTLPHAVAFTGWGEKPSGAHVAGQVLTWQGTLTAHTTLTFTFGVVHSAGYGQAVTNVVSYTQGTRQGSSQATFYVWRRVFLPVALRQ